MSPCDNCSGCPVEQPFGVETHLADGVFVKAMNIPAKGTYVPQHAHAYDHTSMVAVGAVRVWADGKLRGDFAAPHGVFIPAHVKHTMLSLTDTTLVYCIHNVSRSGNVSVAEEHQFED